MFNQPPIKDQSQPDCILQEIAVELDERNEELLVGGTSSESKDITLTATGNITLSAIALPSFLSQPNKGKQ